MTPKRHSLILDGKRRDKRGYEWKSAYREKEALMLERGYPEVSPHDFYRELFPAGSLQQEPEDGKGNKTY